MNLPHIELFQILLAAICGVAIGIERFTNGSVAGVRTYSLVCVGACLFGIVSTHAHGPAFYQSVADPTRIAAQIVSGIGFLGAGIIFRDHSHVHGVTTAANIWVTASIGLAVAFELYLIAIFTTVVIIVILSSNRWGFIKRIREKHLNEIADQEDTNYKD